MAGELRAEGPRCTGEDGFTLVELLVSITLLAVVGAMVFAGVLTMTRAVSVADAVSVDQGYGRTALTLVSRDIRAADSIQFNPEPAFRFAGPRSATFTANLTTGARRPTLVDVRIHPDDGLVVTATQSDPASTAPDLVYRPEDAAPRYVSRDVVSTGAILEYFDADDLPLDQFVVDGGLAEADRGRIASVRITLDLNHAPLQTRPTQLTTTVRLPNAEVDA